MNIIVGIGEIPLFLRAPMYGVALHIANHVFGIVEPILLYIALSEPRSCSAIDGWLGGI